MGYLVSVLLLLRVESLLSFALRSHLNPCSARRRESQLLSSFEHVVNILCLDLLDVEIQLLSDDICLC